MEVLRQLIREITVIVLMAGLFEMLLPDNQLKRFVKLVLGLFVIITLLGPVSYWIKDEKNWGLDSWSMQLNESQAATTVLSPGTGDETRQNRENDLNYQNHLAKQIESLLQMVPGVKQAEARVHLRDGASLYSLDAIKQVEVKVYRVTEQGPKNGTTGEETTGAETGVSVRPVPRIEILTESGTASPGITPNTDAREMTQRIKETISNFYGLPKERILVEVM